MKILICFSFNWDGKLTTFYRICWNYRNKSTYREDFFVFLLTGRGDWRPPNPQLLLRPINNPNKSQPLDKNAVGAAARTERWGHVIKSLSPVVLTCNHKLINWFFFWLKVNWIILLLIISGSHPCQLCPLNKICVEM